MSLYRDAKRHHFKENCLAYVNDLKIAYNNLEPLSDKDMVKFYDKYGSKFKFFDFSEYRFTFRLNEMGLTNIIGSDVEDVMRNFDIFLDGKNMSDIAFIGIYSNTKTKYIKIVITTKP